MKTILNLISISIVLAMAQIAPAAVPSAINYQGRLTNTAGVPQTGIKSMSVKIYDATTDGSLLYSESVGNVTIDANGVYGFQFGANGAGTPPNISTALAAATEQWLELTVDGTAQAPRQKILAVPYALMAGGLPDGAVSSSMIADGAIGVSKITGLGTAATAAATDFATAAQGALAAVSQKRRAYISGPNQALRAFRLKLERGQSAAAQFISDSTGNGATAWIYKLAQALATRYPSHRVEYRQANSSGSYDLTVIQAASQRQNWHYSGTPTYRVGVPNASLRTEVAGRYLMIECELAPTSAAALTGGYPTSGVGFVEVGASNNSQKLWAQLNPSGRISLVYFDLDGQREMQSTSGQPVPPLVVDSFVRYRILLDTANGPNRTCQFHYSTNQGITWTAVGSTITAVKATNSDLLVQTGHGVALGAFNTLPKGGYRYSNAQVGIGANYEPVMPARMDAFALPAGATADNVLLEGSPTLYIDNVAASGAGLSPSSYFLGTGATHLPANAWRLLADRQHDFCCISTSHNDAGLSEQLWASQMNSLRTLVNSRRPAPITFLHTSQNPETAPYYEGLRKLHNERQAVIGAYAAQKGSPFLDVYQAFLDYPGPVSDIVKSTDGVHPTDWLGYGLWRDAFISNALLDGTND